MKKEIAEDKKSDWYLTDSVRKVVDGIAKKFITSFRNDYSVTLDDLKQEIWLKLFSKPDQVNPNDPGLSGYIRKAASWWLIDQLDKRCAAKRCMPEKEIDESIRELTELRFQNNPYRMETIQDVRKAVKLLPQSSKKAVQSFYEGTALSKAAKDNGIPPTTLRDQLKRALTKSGLTRDSLAEGSVKYQIKSVYPDNEGSEYHE